MMPEKFSAMRNSDDRLRSSDSLIENQDSPSLEQFNYKKKQQKIQLKSREKIDLEEHKHADLDLKNELLKLGTSFSEKKIEKAVKDDLEINNEISIADKIKNFKEDLTKQGKSQSEILKILISKFENEESVSTWVENWRNFQKLSVFAESKPPQERRAIQNIIAKADFSIENAFATSLSQISQSTEISNVTKLEISREFNGAKVFSVGDLDNGLKQQQSRKTEIESAINDKSREKNVLNSDIDNLENELEKLSLNDPKRQELEEKIEQKKEVLKQTKSDIITLEKAKPKEVSFGLRSGFSAKLNNDGSRSIKIIEDDFAIKLPSNFLPFTDLKNLRSINLAFPYRALRNQNISNIIFSPNLENNSVPTKRNRDMSHLILSTLKIDDSKILSENDILQLNKDLSRLTSVKNGKSAQEKLIDLGVFDIQSQSLDKVKFSENLKFIRENRGLDDDLFFEKIKKVET